MIGTNDDNVKGRNDVQQADTIASASEAEENKELSEIEKEKAGENLEALGKDELKIKILEYKEIAEKNYDLYLRLITLKNVFGRIKRTWVSLLTNPSSRNCSRW